jgi:hypothetical protein
MSYRCLEVGGVRMCSTNVLEICKQQQEKFTDFHGGKCRLTSYFSINVWKGYLICNYLVLTLHSSIMYTVQSGTCYRPFRLTHCLHLGCSENRVSTIQVLVGARNFYSSPKLPDWHWGLHSPIFSGYFGLVRRDKAAGTYDWPLTSI